MSQYKTKRLLLASSDEDEEEQEEDNSEWLTQASAKSSTREFSESRVLEAPDTLFDKGLSDSPVQRQPERFDAPSTPQLRAAAPPGHGRDGPTNSSSNEASRSEEQSPVPRSQPSRTHSYAAAQDDCFRDVFVNIMVSGMSGLGKTTCIKNMLKELLPESPPHNGSSTSLKLFISNPDELIHETIPTIYPEKGCRVTYRIQDTPGWGDQIDIQNSIDAIIRHVKGRKERERQEWDGNLFVPRDIEYKYMLDACLYFIPPHRFTVIDASFIHQLSREVTVIPIIAKADSMTIDETLSFKQFILDTLAQRSGIGEAAHSILSELEGTFGEMNQKQGALGQVPPFSIICSQQFDETDQPVRRYPWGDCQSWNEDHSDFPKLKRILLNTGMHTLRARRHEYYVRYTVDCRASALVRRANAASEAATQAARAVRETLGSSPKPKWTGLFQKVAALEQDSRSESDLAKSWAQRAVGLVATSRMNTEEAKSHLKAAKEAAIRAEDQARDARACANTISDQVVFRKKGFFGTKRQPSSSQVA